MPLESVQSIFFFVAAVCIVIVTVFLCWALFEIARLVRQANEMVSDTREKLGRIERLVLSIGEKMSSASHYLGFIAEGGRQLISWLHRREEENAEEEEDEETPKKSKKTKKSKSILSEMPDDV